MRRIGIRRVNPRVFRGGFIRLVEIGSPITVNPQSASPIRSESRNAGKDASCGYAVDVVQPDDDNAAGDIPYPTAKSNEIYSNILDEDGHIV